MKKKVLALLLTLAMLVVYMPGLMVASFAAKSNPEITSWPTASSIPAGSILSASNLSGGSASVEGKFEWDKPNTKVNATGSYTVVFKPNQKNTYNDVTQDIQVTVIAEKQTPEITTAPTASAITVGQKLSASTLSGGVAMVDDVAIPGVFAWENPNEEPAETKGQAAKFDVLFTPDDTDSYLTGECKVSVKVNPQPQQYTVTIAVNNSGYGSVTQTSVTNVVSGTSVSTDGNNLKIGATTITPTATTATAQYTYEFEGWSQTTGTIIGDTTITANFKRTAKTYRVTLNKDDGIIAQGSSDVTEYTYGEGATLPTLTKDGFSFDGWFTNQTKTVGPVTAIGTTETGEKTFYAKFTEIPKYTINYNSNSADAQGKMTAETGVLYGADHTLQKNAFTNEGYTFAGWATSESGDVTYADGAEINISQALTENKLNLYAVWVETTSDITLTFHKDAEEPVTVNAKLGNKSDKLSIQGNDKNNVPTLTNGIWVYGDSNQEVTVANNGDVKPAFKTNTHIYSAYEIRFNLNGHGGAIAPTAVVAKYGATISAPTSPTDNDYDFEGWYTESGCENEWNFASTKVTAKQTLFAKWVAKPDVKTITYYGNGGKVNGKDFDTDTYEVGIGKVLFAESTVSYPEDAKVFAGWFDNQEGTGNEVTEVSSSDTGDKYFYAKWTDASNLINVIGKYNGYTAFDKSYTLDTKNDKLADVATKVKADLDGTFDVEMSGDTVVLYDANGTKYEKPQTQLKKLDERTFYIKITTMNACTVTLNPHGGAVYPTSVEVTPFSAYPTLPTPERAGYNFNGWYDLSGNLIKAGQVCTIVGNHELHAEWTEIIPDPVGPVVPDDPDYPVTPDDPTHEVALTYSVDVTADGSIDIKDTDSLKYDAAKILNAVLKGQAVDADLSVADRQAIIDAYNNVGVNAMNVKLTVVAKRVSDVSAAVHAQVKDTENEAAHYDVSILMTITATAGGATQTIVEGKKVFSTDYTITAVMMTGKALNGNVRVLHDHAGVVDEVALYALDRENGVVTVKINKFSTLSVLDTADEEGDDDEEEVIDDDDDEKDIDNGGSKSKSKESKGVKTADEQNLTLWLMFGIVAMIFGEAGFIKRRKILEAVRYTAKH